MHFDSECEVSIHNSLLEFNGLHIGVIEPGNCEFSFKLDVADRREPTFQPAAEHMYGNEEGTRQRGIV